MKFKSVHWSLFFYDSLPNMDPHIARFIAKQGVKLSYDVVNGEGDVPSFRDATI